MATHLKFLAASSTNVWHRLLAYVNTRRRKYDAENHGRVSENITLDSLMGWCSHGLGNIPKDDRALFLNDGDWLAYMHCTATYTRRFSAGCAFVANLEPNVAVWDPWCNYPPEGTIRFQFQFGRKCAIYRREGDVLWIIRIDPETRVPI